MFSEKTKPLRRNATFRWFTHFTFRCSFPQVSFPVNQFLSYSNTNRTTLFRMFAYVKTTDASKEVEHLRAKLSVSEKQSQKELAALRKQLLEIQQQKEKVVWSFFCKKKLVFKMLLFFYKIFAVFLQNHVHKKRVWYRQEGFNGTFNLQIYCFSIH